MNRRRAVTVLLAAGAAVAGGFGAFRSGPERSIRRALADSFGPDLARAPDAVAFVQDLAASGRVATALDHTDRLRDQVATEFALATNAVRAAETGEALVYTGLFAPYTLTCFNPLSSHAL